MADRGLTSIDTNIFIAAFEGDGELKAALRTVIERAEGLVTSLLAYAEVAVRPLSAGDEVLAGFYRSLLGSTGPNLQVRPVDLDVLHEAASLRGRHRALKLPDAIHLATAGCAGCLRFLTFDARLRGIGPTAGGGRPLDVVVPEAATIRTLLDVLTP